MTIRTLEHDHPGLSQFLGRYVDKLPTATASTGIPAYINHGRWVVNCPFCPSAQLASDSEPRFFCVSCRNDGVGGKWLPVLWPRNREVIEGLLAVRPELSTQNWSPPETAKDLARQNAEHGL